MANENAPIGQINPAHLIGNVQPVAPNAAAQMIDAFRSGVVTVDDIIKGVERHNMAKTQQKAADMALAEASAPGAVEARQTAQQLALEKNRLGLENIPAERAMAKAKAEGAAYAQAWENAKIPMSVINDLHMQGFEFNADRTKELPNDADIAYARTAWQTTKRWEQMKDLADKLAVQKREHEKLGDGIGVTYDIDFMGRRWTPGEIQRVLKWRQDTPTASMMKPGDWESVFGNAPAAAPGQVAPAAAPAEQFKPLTVLPADSPDSNVLRASAVSNLGLDASKAATMSDLEIQNAFAKRAFDTKPAVTPPVVPATSAPAKAVVVPGTPAAAAAGPKTFRDDLNGVEIFQMAVNSGKPPTEVQQRAIMALGRFAPSEQALAGLKNEGFDPSSWAGIVYLNRFYPNIFKPQDWQAYDVATQSWAQGILRLESGAAISAREESWYKKAFFAQPGDTPAVMRMKEKLRGSVEEAVGQLAGAGPLPEDLKQKIAGDLRQIEDAAAKLTEDETPTGRMLKYSAKGGKQPGVPAAPPGATDMGSYWLAKNPDPNGPSHIRIPK